MTTDRPSPDPVARAADGVPRWLRYAVAIGWRYSFLVVLALAVVVAISKLWLVVLPVVVALLLAAILGPPTRWLERHGFPPLAATWTVYLASFGLIAALVWAFGPTVADQIGVLPSAIADALDTARSWLVNGPFDLGRGEIDRWIAAAEDAVTQHRGSLIGGALTYALAAVHAVVAVLTTIVLSFFFVKDGPGMVDWILDQLDGERREVVAECGRRAWTTTSGYIRGSALDGLVEGSLKAIGLLVLGVPLVFPLALLTFLGGFVPLVGALLAGTVSTMVALATKGPVTAGLVALLTLLIQNVEGHLLQPLIMGKSIKLHPAVVLVVITAAGLLLGLPGAFLAVPVTAVSINVIGYLRSRERGAG